MIELDVISWILNTLKNEGENLSEYSLEYTTALLMNLSLRISGKNKCEHLGKLVLEVLSELVEHENMVVRTHVNGTLYSILTREKLRAQAIEMGMQEHLEYLKGQSDSQLGKQIQYILNQLNCVTKPEDEEDEDLDNDDEDYDDDYGDEEADPLDDDQFEDEADIMDEDIEKLHGQMKQIG